MAEKVNNNNNNIKDEIQKGITATTEITEEEKGGVKSEQGNNEVSNVNNNSNITEKQ